ncbi:MAG: type III PLP-dependent enzyme [Chitinispirillia bacterium]|nr:type III PLP-dependent enzyme [Chitinispirillia bacterium]
MEFSRAEELASQHGTPVLFLSQSRTREAYRNLSAALCGVDLYYAVKSNAQPELISILESESGFFDVCTNGEIDVVKECGISADRCLHTHPIKRDSDIRYALDFGVKLFVCDNEDELFKFIPYREKAQIIIRMSIQNPGCLINLSQKFGIVPEKTYDLIKKAHDMGLCVKGISFHAGSQNENPLKYIEALDYCRDICEQAARAGIHLEIIDIGGGFPISYLTPVLSIDTFCRPIVEYISSYFSDYRIIAEPGRVLSGPSMTLAAKVIGRSLRSGVWWYYLDEGIYGSFSGKMFDHADYPLSLARPDDERYNSVLAGPTCDSIDVIYENISLPLLEIGDILVFESMGAYTVASSTNFNGFPKAKIVVVE